MAWQKNYTRNVGMNWLKLNSVREAKEIGHLSTSQRQAIIKLIEEKEREIKDS